jgi:hypothetical protein
MTCALASPTIQEVDRHTDQLKKELQSFNLRVKKLVLIRDFGDSTKNVENQVLGLSLLIFMIGLFLFVGWFFSLDLSSRAALSGIAQISIITAYGLVIVSVVLSIKFVRNFSAYLVRYNIQTFAIKRQQEMENVIHFLDCYFNSTTEKDCNSVKKVSSDLKKACEEFRDIAKIFDRYQAPHTTLVRAIFPILLSSSTLIYLLQQITSSNNSQNFLFYFPYATVIIIVSFLFVSVSMLRKENILEFFGVDKSEEEIRKVLEKLNKSVIGDDLYNLFSNKLMIFDNSPQKSPNLQRKGD